MDLNFELSQTLEMNGKRAETDLVRFRTEPAGAAVAAQLKISEGDEVLRVSRLIKADGKPVIYCIDYLPMALVMKLCKGFSLPWGIMFTLGKLGNLLVYGLLMYEAIKRTPVGKVMMSIIGLLPSSLFMACTYSYDPWVMGWLYLGAACFLKEEHINNIERMERKMVIPKGNERAENGSEPSGGGNSMIC